MSGNDRELRLALGMRGGVSLAVWIGGACAEIDELRRAPSHDGASFWKALTDATGYERVVVDVMAGASAGGLNGVLFAACQVYGVPFAAIKETWLDVGSTQQLVRTADTETSSSGPDENPGSDLRWLSLFRGDGHMYHQIDVQLNDLIAKVAETDRPTAMPYIDLRLAATHVEPILRAVRSPSDEQLFERRFGTEFRFLSPPAPWLDSDFPSFTRSPGADRDRFQGNISRLALAARATSSYPGAFEAASVRSTRPSGVTGPPPPLAPGIDVEMVGIFADCARVTEGDEKSTRNRFVVADGGIVDNIPLRRAFDAVAAAPAETPTDRSLVYLHPGVPSMVAPTDDVAADERRRRSVVSVLRAAVGARAAGEDIAGDIAAIDRHNRAVDRAVSVRAATFAQLPDRAALHDYVVSACESYRIQRADEDCRLVGDLLDDPFGFLGEDPFPAAVGGRSIPDAKWRAPVGTLSAPESRALASAVQRRMNNRRMCERGKGPSGDIFRTGARPLIRVTQTLIEWARTIETGAVDPAHRIAAGAAKHVLYTVLAYCEESIERPRRIAWVALLAEAPGSGISEAVDDAMDRLQGLTACTDDEARTTATALLDDDTDVLRTLVAGSRERVDEVVGPGGADPSSRPLDTRREIAERVLVPLAERLRTASTDLEPVAAPEDASPGELLHRVLGGDGVIVLETLAALEVACFGEYATGLPGRRPIDFVRLSAANPTPIAPHFTAFERDARTSGKWWDQDEQQWARQAGLHVELKLAGNELSNFSAFLRKEWRANDWMWGRLDAVPTLVDLMVTPTSLRRVGRSTDERIAEIQAMITADGPDDMSELGAELWAEHSGDIRTEIAALDATPDGESVPLVATRRALVARRQWEILVEELPGTGSVRERIATYRVGAETINDEAVREEIRSRLREIVDAGAKTVVATAAACGVTRWGTADKANLRGRGLQIGIRVGGWFGIRRLLHKK